jgi:hypothetical protein
MRDCRSLGGSARLVGGIRIVSVRSISSPSILRTSGSTFLECSVIMPSASSATIRSAARVRFTAHASFEDPTSTPDAAPRESIEVRALALF